jgi:hypothetical protein
MIAGIAQLPRDASWTRMIIPSMLMHTCTGIPAWFPFNPSFDFFHNVLRGSRPIFTLATFESRAKFYDENEKPVGTVHVRQSVHNPNIALNMQSYVPGGCKFMARDLHERYIYNNSQHIQKFS